MEDTSLPSIGSLPMFSQPEPTMDVPLPEVMPTNTTTEAPEDDPTWETPTDRGGLLGRVRRLGGSGTRITTSDGTGDPRVAGQLVASLAALVASAAAFAVARSGRSLRRPLRRHLDDFGAPVGRIIVRHFDMTRLGPDLADGIAAGVVVGDYVAAGPLILPAVTDHGQLASEEEDL